MKVLLLLALAAASASAYTDDELSFITHEIDLCLRDLPRVQGSGSFTMQIKTRCGLDAWYALYKVSDRSELTPVVVKCVEGYRDIVSQQQIDNVQSCMVERMAKPFGKLDSYYSEAQQDEILDRVAKCLESLPAPGEGPSPKNVCVRMASSDLVYSHPFKEDLEDNVVNCLRNAQFSGLLSDTDIASAKACLRKSLDADLTTN